MIKKIKKFLKDKKQKTMMCVGALAVSLSASTNSVSAAITDKVTNTSNDWLSQAQSVSVPVAIIALIVGGLMLQGNMKKTAYTILASAIIGFLLINWATDIVALLPK